MNFKNNEKRKENNDKAGRLDTRKVEKILESNDIMASLLHTFFNKVCIRSRESARTMDRGYNCITSNTVGRHHIS